MNQDVKILVIDDEELIRERMKKLLMLDDYIAFAAEDGYKALEIYDRELPDIVLSDIKMPGMDGIEVLKEIRKRPHDAEVIMITGHGGVDTAIEALREGAFSYVTKPLDYDELELDIKKALDRIETNRKLAETTAKLKESEQFLNSIITSMADGLFVLAGDGRILSANPAAARMLGVQHQEELVGRALAELIHTDEKSGGGVEDGIKICSHDEVDVLETSFLQESGKVVPVFLTGTTITGLDRKDDDAPSCVYVAKDISELKKAQDRLQQMQVHAMGQEKLASLGELATGVAHEINQPLTYINTVLHTSLEKCHKNKLDPDKLATKFEKCIHQSKRITSIITQLRTFGRAEDVTMQPVQLETVLNNSLILLSERMRLRNIVFTKEIAEKLPSVIGNANKLEQVFINFFQNGIDALEEKNGGEIKVVMDLDGDMVRLRFSDDGSGMPEEVRKKVFEPFFTTKETGKGTGLGMAITYGIIQEHKGEITCESELGKGTAFTVKLPIREKE